jgi:hypothetical protein
MPSRLAGGREVDLVADLPASHRHYHPRPVHWLVVQELRERGDAELRQPGDASRVE